MLSDGSNNYPQEDKANVNTAHNENADNSDDIIPTKNTQPEEESTSIMVSQIEMAQSETAKKNTDTENLQSSAIDSMDISNTQNTEDGNKATMKRRLGMGGPAFTKRRLQVKMQDISTDSDKPPENSRYKGNERMKQECDEKIDVYEVSRNVFHDGRLPETSFQRSQC